MITCAAVKPYRSGSFRLANFEIQPMHSISKTGAQGFRTGLLRCKSSSCRRRQVRRSHQLGLLCRGKYLVQPRFPKPVHGSPNWCDPANV